MMHTPGPWTLRELPPDNCGGNPAYRIDGESTLLLDLIECSDGYKPGQNLANAKLIVVAPELLAFVRDCAENWDCDLDDHKNCRSCNAKALYIKATE